MSQYELIVFDWDGTLMDSTGHIVHCMQQAIARLDLAPLTNHAVNHIIGLGLNEAVYTLYPDASSKVLASLADAYSDIWQNTPSDTPLFANAHHLIQSLNKQNYFLAVATGKSRRGLDKVLVSSELGPLFHATRCVGECHSKPHPQMLEQLITYFGVDADKTLMIGDTEYDLQMAHSAGADSLGISHGAHDVATLQACQPKAIVADLYQVEQWLSNLSSRR